MLNGEGKSQPKLPYPEKIPLKKVSKIKTFYKSLEVVLLSMWLCIQFICFNLFPVLLSTVFYFYLSYPFFVLLFLLFCSLLDYKRIMNLVLNGPNVLTVTQRSLHTPRWNTCPKCGMLVSSSKP